MKTWSGLEAPLDAGGQVSLLDVVVQLGRTRRFGGVGSLEWTVLHHSMLVALVWVKAGYPLAELHFALLHDAHEAYTGDIPGPVKAALYARTARDFETRELGVNPFKTLETEIDVRIRAALDVIATPDDATKRRIKICDLVALLVEGVMFGAPGCDCSVDVPEHLRIDVYALLEQAFPDVTAAAHRHGRSDLAFRSRR